MKSLSVTFLDTVSVKIILKLCYSIKLLKS